MSEEKTLYGVQDNDLMDGWAFVGDGPSATVVRGKRLAADSPRFSGFGGFAKLESNAEAQKMAMLFANGLISFGAMIGPSGWGKTQLMEAAAHHVRQVYGLKGVDVLPASDWVTTRNLQPSHLPLLLDNVQDVLGRTRCRLQLRLALERRIRSGRPTMLAFTADSLLPNIGASLPNRREWIISVIRPPVGSERERLVCQMAAREGLVLSDGLIKVISLWLPGDGRTLHGALKRLKLQGTAWNDVQGTLRGCGVLNPFLSANPKWDLRDLILDTARQLWSSSLCEITAEDLAIYGMLRLALLSEADVALYLGLEPGKAYQRAIHTEEHLLKDQRAAEWTQRFAHHIVETLVRA